MFAHSDGRIRIFVFLGEDYTLARAHEMESIDALCCTKLGLSFPRSPLSSICTLESITDIRQTERLFVRLE